tara:strand:- start:2675 stop:3448 length:774 start_codon:yes stop_codon:yes gene_type:complete
MKIFTDIQNWIDFRKGDEFTGKTVGFVPTMGALHKGHLSLVIRSVEENNITVASIFVNPTQFNNPDDLDAYPRDLEEDKKLLEELGVHSLIFPDYDSLYPDNYRYQVTETEFSKILEGVHRPGHFDGVLTVVLKLLNLVDTDRAYFGEKDYQQYELIRGMAETFFLKTEIVPCPTVRENDGLACSSRNLNLTVKDSEKAPKFHTLLSSDLPSNEVKFHLEKKGFKVDYIEEFQNRRFGAVYLGDVRLIDNVEMMAKK